ncbi:MAG: patatin-like phospholipase family protein [Gemmatimonadetes bacterium]|nr:patatin-like phospholipase family protein [Gemmatimonadota bacterium]
MSQQRVGFRQVFLTGLLLFCFGASAAPAQERPRIGLALSGGSAKGLAHVGVLRVLEREGVPVDVVAGTSMGSIVGGLHAIGVTPDSLAALAVGLDWNSLFTDRVERNRLTPDQRAFDARTVLSLPFSEGRVRLPSGAVEGTAIGRLLARLTWPVAGVRDFGAFPRPFVAVATDLDTGEAVPLTGGVLADALRASMAIPGAIEPYSVGGRLLIDGGLSRNLPAEDARALGADVVICSDVSEPLGSAGESMSFVDVLMQTVAWSTTASTRAQRAACDVLIEPDTEGLATLDFGAAREWIARGEAAAEMVLPRLRAIAEAMGSVPSPGAAAALSDSIRITALRIDAGGDEAAAALIRRTLGLANDSIVGADRLDAVLEDLAATGLVGPVRYRIDPLGEGAELELATSGRRGDQVGLGFRYDDRQRAALLFTATLFDRIQYGSATRLDLRLGEELQWRASYLSGRALTGTVSVGAEVGWAQSPLDVYEGGLRISRAEVEVASAALLLGLAADRASIAALELRGERAVESTSVAIVDASESVWLGSASLFVLRETFDQADFPRTGARLYLRSEVGLSTAAEGGGFSHHVLDVRGRFPVTARASLLAEAHLGYAEGRDVPLHRAFFMGGDHPSPLFGPTQPTFAGLPTQSESGLALQLFRAGIQVEPLNERFVRLWVDAGEARPVWRVDPGSWSWGWGLSIGTASLAGPLSVTMSGGSGDVQWSFNVGRRF